MASLFLLVAGADAQAPSNTAGFDKMAIDGSIHRIRLALDARKEPNPELLIRSLREAAGDMSPTQARRYLETVERGLLRGYSLTEVGGNGGGGKPVRHVAPSKGKARSTGARGLDSPKGLDSARGL
jgi:hypothetical protein